MTSSAFSLSTACSRRSALRRLAVGAAGLTAALTLPHRAGAQQPLRVRMATDFQGVPFWAYLKGKTTDLMPPSKYALSFDVLDDLLLVQAYLEKRLDALVMLAYNMPRVYQKGQKVTMFIPLAWFKVGYLLVAKKAKPYATWQDLQGRKVAYPSLAEDERAYFESMFFRLNKKRLNDVFQPVETDQTAQAVELDQAEAAVVGIEAWGKLARTGNYKIVENSRAMWEKIAGRPGDLLIQGGYAAHPDYIKRQNAFIEDLIEAHVRMWRSLKSNPEEFVQVMSKNTGFPPPVCQIIIDNFALNDLPPERTYMRRQDTEDHRLLFSMMKDIGVYDVPPVDEMFYISKKAPRA